jgi:hypothetical protein
VFGIVRGRKSEQDERVVSAANGGGRTRRAVKVRGPVLGCPRYYSGLRGCGQTFTVERYYAEGRLVQCPYCGLFFPKDLPRVTIAESHRTASKQGVGGASSFGCSAFLSLGRKLEPSSLRKGARG